MADIDGGEVLFTIRGDASQLEAELGRARDGLEDLEGAADDTSGVLDGMGRQAGKLNSVFSGLSRGGIRGVGTAISAVNPAAGRMVSVFGRLAAISGPLTIAVAAVGAAMMAYKYHTDAAADAAEAAAGRVEDLTRALDDQSDIAASINNDFRLITGEIDALGLASEKRSAKVQEAGDAVVAVIDRQIEAQKELIAAEKQTRAAQLGVKDGVNALTLELTAMEKARAEAVTNTENQLQLVAGIEMVKREMKESNEVLRRRAELQRIAAQNARERGQAEAAAILSVQAAEAAAEAERQKKQTAEEERRDKFLAGLDEYARKKEEEEEAAAARALARQETIQAGVSDMMRGTASLSATLSDQMAEDNVKGAKVMFKISQAAALGDIAMATSVAIMKALGNPLGGRIAAAGIAMTGAAQTAIVMAQKPPAEHLGSGMPGSGDPLAPDERLSGARRILAQELSGPGGTVNSMGSSMVNDLNSGRLSGGGGQITAVIGRTHLDQELFQSGRRGTSRYARQLRTNPHPKPNRGW